MMVTSSDAINGIIYIEGKEISLGDYQLVAEVDVWCRQETVEDLARGDNTLSGRH